MKLKKWLALALACLMSVALLTACGGSAPAASGGNDATSNPPASTPSSEPEAPTDYEWPEMTLVCATQASEINEISITSRMFIDKVTEYTNGAIKFDEYFNASLGSGVDQLSNIGNGIADCGDIVTLYTPSDLVLSQITYCLPFAPTDPRMAADIMMEFVEMHPEVLDEVSANGVHTLFYKGIENYDIFGAVPVNTLSDLEGNRFCVGGIYYSPWFQAVGAVPQSATMADMYQNYKNNVNDSGLQFASSWVEFSLYEVAPYWCKVGLGSRACHIFGFNNDTWNSLDPEVQALFEQVAAEVYDEYHTWINEQNAVWTETLTNEGSMIISEMSQEDKELWVQKIFEYQDTLKMWIDDATAAGYDGAGMMHDYLAIAEKYGHEWPFDTSNY